MSANKNVHGNSIEYKPFSQNTRQKIKESMFIYISRHQLVILIYRQTGAVTCQYIPVYSIYHSLQLLGENRKQYHAKCMHFAKMQLVSGRYTVVLYHAFTKTRLFKYIENFTSKNWKYSDKKLWYFSYFYSKHRLWVLVRTASARRF